MKFYFEGKLVRTSKTHDYNWAILRINADSTLKVYGCRADRGSAEAEAARMKKSSDYYADVQVVPLEKK